MKKEARDKAVAEKQRRAEVKERREKNRKEAQVVQKVRARPCVRARCSRLLTRTVRAQITNPKKLSKLSKKQAKKLVQV